MLKSKRIKQLSFLLLVTVFVFVPLQLNKFFPTANIIKADESGDESDYFDNGYEYIEGNVTWGAGDHIIEKGLFIDYGGVLNIEKGARVLFRNNPDQTPYINVGNNGRIIANGTQDEKITFSSIDDGGLYYINFNTYNNSDNTYAEESFFRYVEFFGTKIKQGGGAMSVIQNLFINTANAEGFSFSNIISYGAGKIHIENSTFHNGNININTYIGKDYNKNGFVEIVNSNFELSDEGIAINSNLRCYEELSDLDCSNHVLLKNNWYGNTSGQTPFTINSLVYGKYSLDNWRTNNLITDPVVIVPGIMGSAEVLGTWKIDPILHVYDDLISSFKKNGYENNINLFEFPYNWRKSNAQTAEYLKNAIDVMKNTTKVSKVDIVAHSMGGLVARSYIEGDAYGNDVDKLITIATPQHGSPEAYLKWEAGEGFFTREDGVARRHFENEAKHKGYDDLQKYIQDNVVSVKELLPDYNYLFDVSKNEMRNYSNDYPRNTFLENLNENVNIEKLKQVNFINIIGNTEDNKTIAKIRVVNDDKNVWEYGIPENFNDKQTDRGLERRIGDETVPIYSSKTITSNKEIELNASHQEIPKKAQCEVIENLTGKSNCEYIDNWHIANILLLDVFSPVDIQVISPSGKKYGKDFENNKNFESIDGSYYTGFDTESEFLTIPNPEDGEYKILTQGMGNGEYKIEATKISENENDPQNAIESTAEITGTAIPEQQEELKVEVSGNDISTGEPRDIAPPIITASTVPQPNANGWYNNDVMVHFTAEDSESGIDGESQKDVVLSSEGKNQSVTETFSDKAGNIATKTVSNINIDKTPPEAKINFNSSTQKLNIIGTDNLSQKVSMETKEQEINEPIQQKDKKNISWFFQWLLQKDKGKKIVVTTKLTDEAGHKTELVWEKKKDSNRIIDIAISSISYDGQKSDLSENGLQYKWLFDLRKNKYLLFASHVNTASMSVESHYIPSKNQTWLMEKPKELADDDSDDNAGQRPVLKKLSGMVIPNITTEKGKIEINY